MSSTLPRFKLLIVLLTTTVAKMITHQRLEIQDNWHATTEIAAEGQLA